MSSKTFLPFIQAAILTAVLVLPATADPGDWVNNAGPWFVPHLDPGNPAIGWDDGTLCSYMPSREGDWEEWGTFLSTDLGQIWDHPDPDARGREAVTFEDHAIFAWVCGEYLAPSNYLRRTTDRGQSWHNARSGLQSSHVMCIDLLQDSYHEDLIGTILYAGCNDMAEYMGRTVFMTTDGGNNWTEKSFTAINGLKVKDIDISQTAATDSSVVLAAWYAGMDFDRHERKGIYLTVDGGNSWDLIYPSEEWHSNNVHCAEFSPYSDSVIYIGLQGQGPGRGSIFKTTDKGANWTEFTAIKMLPYAQKEKIVLRLGG